MGASVRPGTSPALTAGAHIVTPRRAYLHHGIYVGNGQVVHYAGLTHGLRGGPVEVIPIDAFAQGFAFRVVADRAARFSPSEVVRRAMSRIGESRYHLLKNNCEHFCEWCLRGEHRSYQVDRLFSAPGRILGSANNLALYFLGAVGRRRQPRETMFVQERLRC